VDFRERIKVGRDMIEKDFILDFVRGLKDEIDKNGYTFFEVTTALAFQYFAQEKVEIAVVETGLGGRLDATNMITPLISIITNIGREHTKQLGDVIAQIANEKAGIVKRGVPTVTAVSQPEAFEAIRAVCAQKKSQLVRIQDTSSCTMLDSSIHGSRFNFSSNSIGYEGLELNLAGQHQLLNAATALAAIQKLQQLGWRIGETALRAGLKNVDWRGRLEIFGEQPLILLDVAHNPPGMNVLIQALQQLFPETQIIFVFGVLEDKDHHSMIAQISKKARFIILTKPDYSRAAEPESLKDSVARAAIPFEIVPQVKPAYHSALKKARADDIICITGSHFTVGEFLGTCQPD
jgi:dihydrofolate synthase/folylpolyglutamate synthase